MEPEKPSTCQLIGKNTVWWGLGNTSIFVASKIAETGFGVTAPLGLAFGLPFTLTGLVDMVTRGIVYGECCGGCLKMHHAKVITACASALFFSAMVACVIAFSLMGPLGIGLLIGFGVLNVAWNAGCAVYEYNKTKAEKPLLAPDIH